MGLKRKIIANNCLNTRGIILRTVHGITTKLNQPALERKGGEGVTGRGNHLLQQDDIRLLGKQQTQLAF